MKYTGRLIPLIAMPMCLGLEPVQSDLFLKGSAAYMRR